MKLELLKPAKALNKAYFKQSLKRDQIELFKSELKKNFNYIDENQDEEYHKNIIAQFLLSVYCKDKYLVNVNKRQDLVIRLGNETTDSVGVILEFKKPTEKKDMVSKDKANVKALQELVLYYLRETVDNDNHQIKHLIATNIYEWFIFDEVWFEKNIFGNNKLKKEYEDYKVSGHGTQHFYDFIATKYLDNIEEDVPCTYFNLKDYEKIISSAKKADDNKLIDLYKILSPEHLLKKPFVNDSNTLNKEFYNELLNIIGLEEKSGARKLIDRKETNERDEGSLLENTITVLKRQKRFGYNEDEETEKKYFDLALELCITWLNRILFLKLLEGQLIKYHRGDTSHSFLNTKRIKDYDELDELFFEVLAVPHEKRIASVNEKYGNIPYLNSSLFEPSDYELQYQGINQLKDRLEMPIYSSTVLKDTNGKRISGKKLTLQYLFEFLEAYNFASDSSAEIQEENKTIINASVLGLIFEKINGYKDGSFFTPGFITMYMCRETIRKAVLQKFNEANEKWNCKTFEELKDKIDHTEKQERKKANEIINTIKICDPAVGSGHFLVSALNELIAVKSDLHILNYRDGSRVKGFKIEIANDELIITNEEADQLFNYSLNQNNKPIDELQELQETLFHEKQDLIEKSLFGVDINPKSVLICRLRLWIELLKNSYYTKESKYEHLETLPNIDINIKCGNSLISRFAVDDKNSMLPKDRPFVKQLIEKYKILVDGYKNVLDKKAKDDFRRQIGYSKTEFQKFTFVKDKDYAELKKKEGELFKKQSEIPFGNKEERKVWAEQLNKLAKEVVEFKNTYEEKLKMVYENSFEWRFEFPEILNNEGQFDGFDVILGNPPYIGEKGHKELFRIIRQANLANFYQRKMDIFYFFFHLGLQLLKNRGNLSFITTNYYLTSDGGEILRTDFKNNSTIIGLINLNELKIFESAKGQHNLITLLSKGVDKNTSANNLLTSEIGDCTQDLFDKVISAKNENTKHFPVPQSELYETSNNYMRIQGLSNKENTTQDNSIFNKIIDQGTPLIQICDISQGILSGVDRVSNKHLESRLIEKENLNQGVYVLTNDEVESKNLSNKELELIRPWFKNSDIHKYWTSDISKYKVIYATRDIEIEDYPTLKKHFEKFEAVIKNRSQERGEMQAALKLGKWWVIFAARTKSVFEGEKIVCPQRTKTNVFGYNNDIWYSSADVYYITNPKGEINLKYILALLNSKLYYFWLYNKGKRKGESLELYYTPLTEIPVKEISKDKQRPFIDLVDKIIKKKGADTPELEKKIDEMIYKLYDLTEEEIKIVANA